jgi:C1A family cysteine protease
MSETVSKIGLGWIPDLPDVRDLTMESDKISQMTAKVSSLGPGGKKTKAPSAPATVDLRGWCPPIENQGSLGSCTANAGVGMVEYFERRAFGKHIDASRLFLYKATRNLLHWTGDTGAYLRTTMKALVLFGVPPEEYWAYNITSFDVEPSAFCYAFGQSYQAITYYRLDPPGTPKPDLLNRIKTYLTAGLPSMFGFTVYASISQAATTGKIPYPVVGERVLGGHAIMAVGYDDNLAIKNTNLGGPTTNGALLIRNSWGTGWGSAGYGWLPYEYISRGQAVDWWSLLKNEWVDTGAF